MVRAVWALGLLMTLTTVAHADSTPVTAPPNNAASDSTPSSAPGSMDLNRAVVERDAEPSVELFRRGSFSLGMAALLQIQGAFFVGDGAAVQFQDPADNEGFRVRRARFGFGGHLTKTTSFYLAIDLKDTVTAALGGDQGAEILDAQLVWSPAPWLHLTVGVDKVPLSMSLLRSSGRLNLIERPLFVDLLVPARRVGMSASGRVPTGSIGALRYAVGVFNGSEGATSGNRLAGAALAGLLQYDLLARAGFVPKRFGLSLGGAYMFDDGPALDAHRIGFNLQAHGFRTRVLAEFLWERSSPDTSPAGGAPNAGETTRWGAMGEITFFALPPHLQVAFRYEYFSDNEELPTLGKQQLITAGLTWYIKQHNLKLQVNYIRRAEDRGPAIANDIAFAQVQAAF